MSEKFEKIIKTRPPFDKRDPDPKKNYGIHGMDIWFILKGPSGAVQFAMSAGVYLDHVADELLAREDWRSGSTFAKFMAIDLGYHSPTPRYEDQPSMDCELLEGGKCYYDGSGLNAEPVLALYLEGGDDAVWSRLEAYYHDVFGRGPDND